MKGFKAVNMTKVLAELEALKKYQSETNNPGYVKCFLEEDGTWEVKVLYKKDKKKMKSFKLENITELNTVLHFSDSKNKVPVLKDYMILQTDMYLPTDIILYKGKETVKKFIDLALNHNEEEYMKAYIELFDKEFGISEPDFEHWIKGIGEYDYRYNNVEEQEKYNNWLKNKYQESFDAVRNLLAQYDTTLADFFENYKKLSIEELVERYKDKRFFKPKL